MKRGVLITFMAILIPWLLQAQETPNEPQNLSLEQAVTFPEKYRIEEQNGYGSYFTRLTPN